LGSYANALIKYNVVGNAGAGAVITAAQMSVNSEAVNPGYNARLRLANNCTTTAQDITVVIPLARLFGFCQVERAFFGCEHLIRFQRNNIADILFCSNNIGGAAVGDIYFSSSGNSYGMEWWIPAIQPNLTVQKNLFSDMANNAQQKIVFEAGYGYGKQPGAGQPTLSLTLTKKRPTKAIFVIRAAYQVTNINGNPTTFIPGVSNNTPQSCYLLINGRSYPELRYDFYFAFNGVTLGTNNNNGVANAGLAAGIVGAGGQPTLSTTAMSFGSDVGRLYEEYLKCADKYLDYESGALFNFREFAVNYPMYCFDLRKLGDDVFENPSNILQFVHTGAINNGDWVDAVILYESYCTISSISNQIQVSQ
jgi:hypothetical protein